MSQRILVVYYSLTGNTQRLAQAMAQALGADELSLQPVRSVPTSFMRYLIGGFAAMTKRGWPLKPTGVDPAAYDVVFVGGPNWASAIAPPLRQFLTTNKLSDQVAFFASAGGGTAEQLFAQMRELLGVKAPIAERAFGQSGEEQTAADWAKQVLAALKTQ